VKLANDHFAVVIPNKTMVETVLQTWDQRPPYVELSAIPCYGLAKAHFRYFYKSVFCDPLASSEEVVDWLDMSRSGGYPANYFKLRSKKEVLSDPGYQKFLQEFNFCSPAYHWVKPKTEVLPMENILKNKCRLFVIPELALCYLQLKFGKRISLRIKNYRWSAYGFNPYHGGCHLLALRLLSKPIRFYYDVSGWDKFLGLLPDIYNILRDFSGYPDFTEREKQEFDWMVLNTTEMYCVMHDGSVYLKKYGNGSGSGTTTRDNIFAHILILATILYSAFFDKYGKYPNPRFVEEQIVNLFGDDSICSVDEEFDSVLKPNFVADIFAKFGMTLKYFFGGKDYPLEKMEFLGFSFKKIKDHWFPLYSQERLAAGLVYEGVNSNTRESFLSKTFVLTFMSYPCDQHEIFRKFGFDVAKHFATLDYLSPTERVMVDFLLTMQPEEIECAFLGLEGSYSPAFSNFFSLALEEVGI
jgi:hypothetical protein